ncbi:MAG: TlpA family protein disulfide reductase [Blastocatellia bacterium]
MTYRSIHHHFPWFNGLGSRHRGRLRILSRGAALLPLPAMLAVCCLAQQSKPPAPPTMAQFKAEKFVVRTLDGKRVDLNSLLGSGKVVVLDFWTTWCGPCRQEIPHLNQIAENHRKDGLLVIGLNLESPTEDREAVRDFVRELKMKYPSVFAPDAIYQFFNPNATGYRIPQTVVFDARGQLVRRLVGYNATRGKEILDQAVAKALGKAE